MGGYRPGGLAKKYSWARGPREPPQGRRKTEASREGAEGARKGTCRWGSWLKRTWVGGGEETKRSS